MTTLLACSAGGHLKQLHRLLPRFELNDDVVWLTFDTGLSRSLLADENFVIAKHAAPREVKPLLEDSFIAGKLVKKYGIKRVISTGSGLAIAAFPQVLLRGGQCHYIESAARATGPSVSGKVVSKMPGVHLYSQYPSWASGKWSYGGAVFDGFELSATQAPPSINKVVVTLGTSESHQFRRLLERLVKVIPSNAEVLWQTGVTDVAGLSVEGRHSVPAKELEAAIAEADVIISHSGVGASLSTLEAGRCPILVPRRMEFGEHIDNHQIEIARELSARGLALAIEVDELTEEDLFKAAAMRVTENPNPPKFKLKGK